MTVSEVRNAAADFMEAMAADDAHGYDQSSRWGPDYDCSSLVISAWKKAGVPLTCTYTGNMRADMLTHGFKDVTKDVNLATGSGLKRGDVLLHATYHTAMFVGNGKIVHAAGNERGGATGGKPGDQTGKEICVASYYNFPWQYVLRFSKTASVPTGSRAYTVKAGDSLWAIAQRELGNGSRYPEIMALNHLTERSVIVPGQVLYIPAEGGEETPTPTPTPAQESPLVLPDLKRGDKGSAVRALQTLLLMVGIDVGTCGADGEFGEDTWVAVCDLQRTRGTTVTGEVHTAEWRYLILEN